MDIIDSQVHLGPGGAAEMVAAMDALGIRSALIDEWWKGTAYDPAYAIGGGILRPTSPTSELAAWTFPGRFAYLVRVDRRDPEMRSIIRLARDATHARALRIAPGMTRAELAEFADGAYDGMFAAAAECGLPVFVWIGGNTHLLERYAQKFQDAGIIICHCGMPPGKAMGLFIAQLEGEPDSVEHWTRVGDEPSAQAFDRVLRLADRPNVALKWAHAPLMFRDAGYPNAATRPCLRRALDSFGAERIMWASDISANQTGETWAELLFAIRNNSDLSPRDQEYILGRTAREWLNWDAG
jgi:predicted TIM-barrel fold metal-dependent hydrolase